MQYLRMVHESLSTLASFINKAMLVAGVCLAITGYFFHFHHKDLSQKIDTKKVVRENIYQNINSLKNDTNPKSQIALRAFRFSTCTSLGEGCTDNPIDGDKNYNSSILGFTGNLIALPYQNPPSSGVAYVQDSLQNAGFVPKTHAAGIGFYSLSGFQKLWKIFRNITFFLMALAIVIVGFLIMFRVKIDSQTVISLENSLPRIVITLLLITFSYAIAGFLVDIMYVLIMLAINLLGNVADTGGQSVNVVGLKSVYLTNEHTLLEAFMGNSAYMNAYVEGLRGLLEIIPNLIRVIIYGVIYFYLYTTLLGLLARLGENFDLRAEGSIVVASLNLNIPKIIFLVIFQIILAFVIPLLIYWLIPYLLAIVVLLFLFFRIFWLLLNSYVQIIINVIFAPVLILPNVIPGNNAFMDWLKRLIGNLLAFPITVILLITVQLIAVNDEYIGGRFLGSGGTENYVVNQFSMPMIPFKTSQLVPIIAAVFLLIIPKLVKKITDSIAGPPIIEAGPGELVAGVGGAVGTVVGQYTGLASLNQTLRGRSPIGTLLNKTGLFGKASGEPTRVTEPPPGIDPTKEA